MVASAPRPRAPVLLTPVSIPFIAGQWSLRKSTRDVRAPQVRFNPLHCGAVVASVVVGAIWRGRARVSIPFIAGQWSLLSAPPAAGGRGFGFQSPSLRGSGRFLALAVVCRPAPLVSIPFIAGQWSLRHGRHRRDRDFRVSIPFIAGQWSLQRASQNAISSSRWFQSPSLRGSGRFPRHGPRRRRLTGVSIPFIAGQWSLHRRGGRV